MSRARVEIPTTEARELRLARGTAERAQVRLRAAVVAALVAGGSYSSVAEAAGVARSTVQEWAKS